MTTRLKIQTDTPETKAFWSSAFEAAQDVATWPEWKRLEGKEMTEKSGPGTDSWFTPDWLIQWAHAYLGGPPDFDPASCHEANLRVRAKSFDTDDGARLFKEGGFHRFQDSSADFPYGVKTVFMNPPFSKAKQFWHRLWDWRRMEQDRRFFAIMPANVNSAYFHHMVINAYVWIPAKRVAFVDPRTGQEAKAPRGNVCVVTSSHDEDAPEGGMWVG